MKDRVVKSLILLVCGTLCNIALAGIKMYVGLKSNSITIMLDATNSTFDIITCIVTIIAVAILLAKRSDMAPYGYGRSEYLAGFIVAVVSVVIGVMFFVRSLNRLAMPEPVYFGLQSCILLSVGIPVKLAIGFVYFAFNRKIKSKAISAIMLDSFLDAAMTATSLMSYIITTKVDYAVDGIFGIIMSIIVVAFALKMVYDNLRNVLIGDGAKEERAQIELICQQTGVEIEKLSLHDYGYKSKVGTLCVGASVDTDKLKEEIHSQTGVDIDIFVVDNNPSNDTSVDDDTAVNE